MVGGADIDIQCLRSAQLNGARMERHHRRAATSRLNDHKGSPRLNFNKHLSLREIADFAQNAKSAPPASGVQKAFDSAGSLVHYDPKYP